MCDGYLRLPQNRREVKITMKVCRMEQAVSSASNGFPTHPGSVASGIIFSLDGMHATHKNTI